MTRYCVASALIGTMAFSASLTAQTSVFATQVLGSNTNGQAGGGIFAPTNTLGAPDGALNVHSLGIGGDLTLGFDLPITNGPGADFIVSENPFRLSTAWWTTFAEVMFVEVSSNGVDFARFPSNYYGPASQPGAFGTLPVGSYSNLAGQTPVTAMDPGADPQDVVEAGGDAFDLEDLANHALVANNLLDLQAITHVRLVDVVSGTSVDASGVTIYDPGTGSADVDSITVIHQQGQVPNGNPSIDFSIATDGTMTLRIEDPDGWTDLDPATFRAALFGVSVDAGGLLAAFSLQSADNEGFTLVQNGTLPPGLLFTMSMSIKDMAGNRSGLSRTRPN